MLNKRTIIIIILAILIFFSSATLVFFLTKRVGNKAPEKNTKPSFINALIDNNKGLSSAQLKFYEDTAAKGSVTPCLGRQDESNCVNAVAFIRGDRNYLCHELEHENNEELYKQCASGVINRIAKTEIDKCASLSGDDYHNCLWAVFSRYSDTKDCAGLYDKSAKEICVDFFTYRAADYSYDRTLCQTIKDEKLNQYCLKNIKEK